MDLKGIEAVEQVAAEFSLLNLLLNVDIGGSRIVAMSFCEPRS